MSPEAAVAQALAEQRVDASYAKTIQHLVASTQDEWRYCCGSGCDPCVLLIGPVVDRARELLGIRKQT